MFKPWNHSLPLACLLALVIVVFPVRVAAWDATGHRLSAYVAWEFMSEAARSNTLTILRQHPRFDQDFLAAMPEGIQQADTPVQERWLFGQAAIWPDTARSFTGADQMRYNHPEWHWIDGAWLRDEAVRQGNLYVDTPALPPIQGAPAHTIRRRAQAENIVTAIDWLRFELQNNSDNADKAVALSWLAHLIGDIHQPLHTGALVSARLYADGDRGGNAIQVRGGNLHSVWDRALREQRLERTMPLLLDIAREFRSDSRNMEFAHTRWLQESRDLLLGGVYPDAVISDVLRSENTGNQPGTINLGQAYEEQMRAIAAQRIAEAGVRLAQAMELL